MSIDEIIENQGWNESTVNDLLFRYIENHGSMDALADFLERVAQEENGESGVDHGRAVSPTPAQVGHVFVERLSKVEVVFLDEHQGWDSMVVEIPEEVAKTQSQDAFIKWVYSAEGERFRRTWHKDVMSVYVMSWRDDLDASGHPAVADDNEPDVLYGRGDAGQWSRFERSDDENTVAYAVFQVWEQGERNIFSGAENTALYTQREAEGHLEVLIKRANTAHDFEIASLRKMLGKT